MHMLVARVPEGPENPCQCGHPATVLVGLSDGTDVYVCDDCVPANTVDPTGFLFAEATTLIEDPGVVWD